MTAPGTVSRCARAGGTAALVAAVCYSSFLLSRWTHAAPSANGGFVSELEAPGQPYAWLYRSSDVLAGLGILVAAWTLRPLVRGHRWSTASVLLLALTGAASVVDGATTMSCDPGTSARCAQHEHTPGGLLGQLAALHTDSGLVGFAASAIGAIMLGAVLAGRWPSWGRMQIALGTAMGGCGLADLGVLLASGDIGSIERVRVLLTSGWFLVLGLFLFRRQASRPQPAVRRAGCKVAS